MLTNCEFCGRPFDAPAAEINRGNGRFCDLRCAAKYNNGLRTPVEPVCAGKCAYCGKDVYRKPYRLNKNQKHYCDRRCKALGEMNLRQADIDGRRVEIRTESRARNYGTNRRHALNKKKELIADFGVKCFYYQCNCELYNDRRLVDIHHFGDSSDNNKTVLLCPYHHRLAHAGYLEISGDGVVTTRQTTMER